MPDLLIMDRSPMTPPDLVEAAGSVLAIYDHRTQDSGNISWLVRTEQGDLFVKTAGTESPPPGAPVPYLGYAERVGLLRTAVEIARSAEHPTLARLRTVIETPLGPMLVYDRAPGELVHVPSAQRHLPDTPYRRFATAPTGVRLAVFDQLLGGHAALEAAGWVACDLYDGCLMVDHESGLLTVIDLDTYRRGPSVNDMGRMFGSSVFMAPEEFELGAMLDSRTTVFTLGRLLRHFGTGLSEDLADFCGGAAAADVIAMATEPAREGRFATVAELAGAWESVRASMPSTVPPR